LGWFAEALAGKRIVIASLIVCFGALPVPGQAQTSGSLDGLFRRMASIESLECHFREEKHIALLSAPIVTEGAIHYVRPGRMARRATSPSSQVLLIDGSSLRMWDGSREETIDLASQPVVRSFVDSILSLLAGDRAALERNYTLALAPSPEGLILTLTPRSRPLDQFLRSIRFTMTPTYDLLRMEMQEVSGDSTVTTFSAVNDHRRYTASDLERLFRLR
jgi:outer membrane lipoprotein-sorting protein